MEVCCLSLDIFMNDRYLILKLLNENMIKIKEEVYVYLNQQEIADLAHFSKQKTNRILNELITQGYIYTHMRGKYSITELGERVIQIVHTF